ncbi:hypothetical protein BC939DRAFT_500854 [Gamsiella multidivaricata]|uniref:uncharacterized protein n=1 Tax=Gamsiella multidivaricata TaxID=101098 RepID=UPI00221F795B|nr:uncharacterized protein BC939DRAFT_500854 [Gamsiella multidivaricata]KAG0371059.1 hypothetical protein BGZ54_000977 [Gamsiella multidivaricata]KAI7828194.1 hypothetical protein BC939DRAFT_500854 [Gamsiella multidivaricata]
MSTNNLAIKTSQSPPAEEDDSSQAMPLSPASVRSYQKNKAQKNKKKTSKEQSFSKEETSSDDDDGEASYESDKKSDEDDEDDGFDAAHLDPRLEALDGTMKLKTASEEEDREEDEEDDDQDYSNEEDAESPEVHAVSDFIPSVMLDSDAKLGSIAKSSDAISPPPSLSMPGIAVNGAPDAGAGELYQDPTSTGSGAAAAAAAAAANQGQEERLQEPMKPHIALPCLVETAKNPARTRITLKYAGNDHSTHMERREEQEQKTSTRGRKNYMVATDLSGESWHATEWAITTILRNGDELNVVTIVEDDKSDTSKAVKKGVQAEMREDAEKLTKNIHEQLEHTCLRDITVVIHIIAATKSMGAKELLIEMIDDLDDLSTVIVGSRGRGAIKGLLLGSISNFLVHNSSVPVMVVRAPKKSKGKKKTRRGRFVEQTRSVKEANLKYEQAFANEDY